MIASILLAGKIFFTRPRLFFLAVFPGLFTFAVASGLLYLAWTALLATYSLWLSIPMAVFLFLVFWLLVGNLSLLPVEDAIINECQRAYWGEERLPDPGFGWQRLLRELLFSLMLLCAAAFFLLLSFLPFLGWISLLFASWMSAYGFLSPLYARKFDRIPDRLRGFFRHPLENTLLGFFFNLLFFLPLLNVFFLGYAQILSSVLFFKRMERKGLA